MMRNISTMTPLLRHIQPVMRSTCRHTLAASFHSTRNVLADRILNQATPIEHSKGGAIQDFDLLQDLPRPPMSIDTVLDNGFRLSTGDEFDCRDNTVGCLIVEGEVFEWDFSKYVEGLDTGLVSIDEQGLGVVNLLFPRPELLLVGLGGKSRILSEHTRRLLMGMGYTVEVADTVSSLRCHNKQ